MFSAKSVYWKLSIDITNVHIVNKLYKNKMSLKTIILITLKALT